MTEPRYFDADDGVRLAWYELGAGRPVVLIHGYVSDAHTNWIRYGHAATIAARGYRVIMPDLRAHGASDRPHDPAAYPRDILADDGFALLRHLGLERGYDLGGYSLGARTTMRLLARGATPDRVILAGMGLKGLTDAEARVGHFRRILTNLGTFQKFTPEWNVEAFIKTTKADPVALNLLLDAFISTPEAAVRAVAQPTLVLTGIDDDENGAPQALADAIPDAELRTVPGGHMSAVTKPEMGEEIARFLAG